MYREESTIMKVVLLAGGYGTRISEESHLKPKPMIDIGGMPILWHIMKLYSFYGFYDFIICAGYKQEIIKEWFSNYFLHTSDVTFDIANNDIVVHKKYAEPWKVTVVDTGLNTMTGGRLKRIKSYVDGETFLMTYGDGVSNVSIPKLIDHHNKYGKLATLTAVQPDGRFGVMDMSDVFIDSFREKSRSDTGWINGGFMVLSHKVLDYIEDDTITFEREPLERLAYEGELVNYKHHGFWQCMDTLRDKQKLDELWDTGRAPWKVWE